MCACSRYSPMLQTCPSSDPLQFSLPLNGRVASLAIIASLSNKSKVLFELMCLQSPPRIPCRLMHLWLPLSRLPLFLSSSLRPLIPQRVYKPPVSTFTSNPSHADPANTVIACVASVSHLVLLSCLTRPLTTLSASKRCLKSEELRTTYRLPSTVFLIQPFPDLSRLPPDPLPSPDLC